MPATHHGLRDEKPLARSVATAPSARRHLRGWRFRERTTRLVQTGAVRLTTARTARTPTETRSSEATRVRWKLTSKWFVSWLSLTLFARCEFAITFHRSQKSCHFTLPPKSKHHAQSVYSFSFYGSSSGDDFFKQTSTSRCPSVASTTISIPGNSTRSPASATRPRCW